MPHDYYRVTDTRTKSTCLATSASAGPAANGGTNSKEPARRRRYKGTELRARMAEQVCRESNGVLELYAEILRPSWSDGLQDDSPSGWGRMGCVGIEESLT
jgi:hypothetical protein